MFDILIADDEQLARETVKFLLAQCEGIGTVHEANNGKSALQIAQQYLPKIVMLDIEMPNINGIEVAKQLPDDTSIIFITAFSHFEEHISSINCASYLLKPFKDEEFYECFEKARALQYKHSEQAT
jgi:YesN/AraC family two-component response regulator